MKLQLLSSLQVEAEDIIAAPTKYSGITLLKLSEHSVSTVRGISNTETFILNESPTTGLL